MRSNVLKTPMPASAARLLWLTVAQLVLAFIIYVPFALGWPVWLGSIVLAGLTAAAALYFGQRRGVRIAARAVWILVAVARWLIVAGCVYACVFWGHETGIDLGYDAASRINLCAGYAAAVCAIAATWMPAIALAVAAEQRHFDGIIALLASLFNFLVAIFLHGYEPLGIGAVRRITDSAPAWLAAGVNAIAVVLALGILVAAFFALPAREPKKPRAKTAQEPPKEA